jgi:hypothetical protein
MPPLQAPPERPLRPQAWRRRWLVAWRSVLSALLLLAAGSLLAPLAQAQNAGVELVSTALRKSEGQLTLDFAARLNLSRTVEDALQRGVPVYFVAQATVLRSRWYWRDERIARVQRSWRVAYQPLTANWRVAQGGIGQSYASLGEALVAISRVSAWKLADLSQIDADARHYVEFSFRLDTSQLPSPMQIGLTNQGDWAIGAERTLRVE